MGLFSFITLTALKMHQIKPLISIEAASWYDKKGDLTFSDVISVVKRSIWSNKYFSRSQDSFDFEKYTDETINSLIYQLSLAA